MACSKTDYEAILLTVSVASVAGVSATYIYVGGGSDIALILPFSAYLTALEFLRRRANSRSGA